MLKFEYRKYTLGLMVKGLSDFLVLPKIKSSTHFNN